MDRDPLAIRHGFEALQSKIQVKSGLSWDLDLSYDKLEEKEILVSARFRCRQTNDVFTFRLVLTSGGTGHERTSWRGSALWSGSLTGTGSTEREHHSFANSTIQEVERSLSDLRVFPAGVIRRAKEKHVLMIKSGRGMARSVIDHDYDGYLRDLVSDWYGSEPRDPVEVALFHQGVDEALASIARGDFHQDSYVSTMNEGMRVETDLSKGGKILRKTTLTDILRKEPANVRRNAINFYASGYQQVLRRHLGERPRNLRGSASERSPR